MTVRFEKISLQGCVSVQLWVDVADYLRLLRHLSDHLHAEQINPLCFIDELSNGHEIITKGESTPEVEPQLLLYCILSLLPLDEPT